MILIVRSFEKGNDDIQSEFEIPHDCVKSVLNLVKVELEGDCIELSIEQCKKLEIIINKNFYQSKNDYFLYEH